MHERTDAGVVHNPGYLYLGWTGTHARVCDTSRRGSRFKYERARNAGAFLRSACVFVVASIPVIMSCGCNIRKAPRYTQGGSLSSTRLMAAVVKLSSERHDGYKVIAGYSLPLLRTFFIFVPLLREVLWKIIRSIRK